MSEETLPETMQAVELRAYRTGKPALSLVKRKLPVPGEGEVLVKIAAAPINPSDLMFLKGLYGVKKKLPVIPGFEGSGVVVAAGAGSQAQALLGRRVACNAPRDGDGTWAEYMRAPASSCVPLLPAIDLEAGATLIVNPLTAFALIELARRDKHTALVQTAAASSLGRMVQRLADRHDIEVINVVRRPEQVKLLKKQGAEHVLDSSRKDFARQLKAKCWELQAGLAFDAVGGPLTGTLAAAMPESAHIVVYGALSLEPCTISAESLIFNRARVEGFWLVDWFRATAPAKVASANRAVQRMLGEELRTEIQGRFPLKQVGQALAQYEAAMSSGKVLLVP